MCINMDCNDYFGALPFVINQDIPNYIDALFETMSGFTTTGASIVPDITQLAHSSLFGAVLLTGLVEWEF